MLTSLPRSRPVRRSAKRDDRADAKNGAGASDRRAAAKPAAPTATATAAAERGTAPRRKVPAGGYAAPPRSRADQSPGCATADLLSTTIQAAAELAQIGLTVGRQTLRSMLDRLPKL